MAEKTGKLHVPEPRYRPGDTPSFEHMDIPRAGAVPRPAIDVEPTEIRDLAYTIIRVTDRHGKAVGPWAGEISDEEALTGLKNMMRLRAYDSRMVTAQRQGKTSFYMQALGEEAVSCAFQATLNKGDMNFGTYRQQGLLLAAGYPIVDMMNQVYSNSRDPLVGRQMPIMYSSKEYGYFSISGNLGTQFIQGVGWSMASAISGDSKIATAWVGDGATAEGDVHAGMLFASTFKAPVILNIVNNQWAISTYQGFARGSAATFAARGLGFGIPSLRVDGNDFLAVYAVAKWAGQRARAGHGATLIEYVTYRAGPHSTSDDPSAYRSKDEPNSWPLGDPIERLKQHLITRDLWSDERHVQMQAEIEDEIKAIQKQAEANGTLHSGHSASPKEMFEGVYKEMPDHLVRQRQKGGF